MKVVITDRALAALIDAPLAVRKAFYKQLGFLERSLLILPCTPRSTTKSTICGRRG